MPKLRVGPDQEVWQGRFISIWKRPYVNVETGKTGHWEMVKRQVFGHIVAIVAVTPDREVVFIKIFRVPLKQYVIECAAGLPDRPGENEKELASRELLEETGYRCEHIKEIMSGPLNGGLVAEELVYFLGTGAKKVAEPKHETAEDIEVIKIPLAHFEAYLRNPPNGALVDLKMWALLPFLAKL